MDRAAGDDGGGRVAVGNVFGSTGVGAPDAEAQVEEALKENAADGEAGDDDGDRDLDDGPDLGGGVGECDVGEVHAHDLIDADYGDDDVTVGWD